MTKYLVQILLPTTNAAKASSVFEDLAGELTKRFGGVTSYLRAPAEGRWLGSRQVEHDEITVVEVMVEEINGEFWRHLRHRLEKDLNQKEIIIRCQPLELI